MQALRIIALLVAVTAGFAASPHARVEEPRAGGARWTSGFWHERFELARQVMAPFLWEYMQGRWHETGISGIGRSQAWNNLQIAAGLRKGDFDGRAWSDGDFYKWLEALAHIYAVTREPELDRLMDEAIAVIARAQQPDGYINSQITIPGKDRWAVPENHETYNMGHLLLAGVAHYRATGKRSLLDVAVKAGDCLHREFAPPSRHFPGYSAIMGLVELHRATGARRYLELANEFVGKQGAAKGNTDKFQDRTPLRKESKAAGHAVWGTYLYSGAADVFAETGEPALMAALRRIWDDLYTHKAYITGSVSGAHHTRGAGQAVFAEAFGYDYRLPSASASNETCSHIGAAMWNFRLFKATGEARYMDEVERVIYNSFLAGMGLEGKTFFYTNPLRRHGADGVFLEDDTMTRWTHRIGYCCPPNILRVLANLHQWAWASAKDEVWVNLYGSGAFSAASGVKLEQRTDYPWGGKVHLTVQAPRPTRFALRLRIPAWAGDARLSVNGAAAPSARDDKGYASVAREWKTGDAVDLEFAMPVQMVRANPYVDELQGQIAVQRGPVVYCLESPDLPGGVRVQDVAIPVDAAFAPRYDAHLLGGVTTLETRGVATPTGDWSGLLYRTLQFSAPREVPVRLIPYYAWANRGISHMSVWLPLAEMRQR